MPGNTHPTPPAPQDLAVLTAYHEEDIEAYAIALVKEHLRLTHPTQDVQCVNVTFALAIRNPFTEDPNEPPPN